MLEVGQDAPKFCLPNQDNVEICLRDLVGKWVILYFYPKDNTPGCTTQACDFNSSLPNFEELNAIVLGVSPDSTASHQKFIDKQSLNFTLLSDVEKKVLSTYDVWKLKKFCGRESMGVERSTFIIDQNGKIAKIYRNVKVKGHIEELKKELINLQK
ncbi:MAG: thioredoxin-dependent thiol peroxidase [Campylobacteraceae bacterium]|jgi:peroxiredoxin Q/BCP|nr:thioredoxin-dependent thiol peroxidase [Campylobacteraceae bacterium]